MLHLQVTELYKIPKHPTCVAYSILTPKHTHTHIYILLHVGVLAIYSKLMSCVNADGVTQEGPYIKKGNARCLKINSRKSSYLQCPLTMHLRLHLKVLNIFALQQTQKRGMMEPQHFTMAMTSKSINYLWI